MNIQKEILIAKANLMYELDPSISVERSYNSVIGEILARIGENRVTLVIDNFNIDIQNIAMLEICRTISQIKDVPIMVVTNKYGRKLKKYMRSIIISDDPYITDGSSGFYVSPKMFHDFYNEGYSDSRYFSINYYPLMKMVYRDVKTIASGSPLMRYVKKTYESLLLTRLYQIATNNVDDNNLDTNLITTMNRIIAGRANLTKKFLIIGSGEIPYQALTMDCDRIILYNRNDIFEMRDIPYGRRPRKENQIYGKLNEFLEENQYTDIVAFGYFTKEDTEILEKYHAKVN